MLPQPNSQPVQASLPPGFNLQQDPSTICRSRCKPTCCRKLWIRQPRLCAVLRWHKIRHSRGDDDRLLCARPRPPLTTLVVPQRFLVQCRLFRVQTSQCLPPPSPPGCRRIPRSCRRRRHRRSHAGSTYICRRGVTSPSYIVGGPPHRANLNPDTFPWFHPACAWRRRGCP